MDTTKARYAGVGSLRHQVRQFLDRFAQTGTDALSSLLNTAQLERLIRQHCTHQRERTYPPMVTVGLFLEQVLSADHSCQDAVARGLSHRVAQNLSTSSLNTGPYCKARQRLSSTLLPALGKTLGQHLCHAQSKPWRWRGREVKLIDGTTVTMPDTALNQASYPQSTLQKTGLGFPVMRIVGILSLGCGAVLDWVQGACSGKLSGETAMLRQFDAALSPGDILLMDRYYTGYFTVARLLAQGVDFVSRQHQLRHTDFRKGLRLGKGDHVAVWSRQELNKLYCWRWHVELDFRAIKSVLQMDVLRCKTPEMVIKEVAAHLLAYNLVRSVMAQSASQAGCLPRQLSFKGALQHLRVFEEQLRHGAYTRVIWLCEVLIVSVAKLKLPHRPGRVEPRAIKRRSKNQSFLTQPRGVLKAQLQAQRERKIAGAWA